MIDPYEILGVTPDASGTEIRDAYKKLAQEWHPDKHPEHVAGATKKFQEIAEAYTTLSDDENRARYDDLGDTEPNEANELAAAAISMLTESALEIMDKPGDLRAALRMMCEEIIKRSNSAILDARIQIKKRQQFAKRWKNKMGNRNIFANAIRRQVRRLEDDIETSKASIEIAEECLCILAEYTYDERGERPPALSWGGIFRADVP